MSRRMLLDEQPMFVLPSLAVKYGLTEAMVLQQLHFALGREHVLVENGSRWVKLNLTWWQKQFPWWSESTIKRAIADLNKQGLIEISRGREGNAFTLNYTLLEEPETGQSDLSGQVNMTSQTGQSDLSPCKREVEREEQHLPSGDGQLFDLPSEAVKSKPKPKPAASSDPETDAKVQKIWEHYARVFDGRFRLGLTQARDREIRKGLKATDGDVDICLRAIDGLKSYRDRGVSSGTDVSISVIFSTGPQSKSNLTDQIAFWAGEAGDNPTVTGGLSGVMKARANQALLAAKQAKDHPDDRAKQAKAETELAWLESKGYTISFDEQGKPRLESK